MIGGLNLLTLFLLFWLPESKVWLEASAMRNEKLGTWKLIKKGLSETGKQYAAVRQSKQTFRLVLILVSFIDTVSRMYRLSRIVYPV